NRRGLVAVAQKKAGKQAAARAGQKAARRTAKSITAERTATSQPRRRTTDSNGSGAPEAVDQRALEELLEALTAARNGDFSRRLSARRRGMAGELAAAYNELMGTNADMTRE